MFRTKPGPETPRALGMGQPMFGTQQVPQRAQMQPATWGQGQNIASGQSRNRVAEALFQMRGGQGNQPFMFGQPPQAWGKPGAPTRPMPAASTAPAQQQPQTPKALAAAANAAAPAAATAQQPDPVMARMYADTPIANGQQVPVGNQANGLSYGVRAINPYQLNR